MFELREVERQRRQWQLQALSDHAGREPFRAALHKQAENVEPALLRQSTQAFDYQQIFSYFQVFRIVIPKFTRPNPTLLGCPVFGVHSKAQIRTGPRWARDEIRRLCAFPPPQEALLFSSGGWIDRPFGECRIKRAKRAPKRGRQDEHVRGDRQGRTSRNDVHLRRCSGCTRRYSPGTYSIGTSLQSNNQLLRQHGRECLLLSRWRWRWWRRRWWSSGSPYRPMLPGPERNATLYVTTVEARRVDPNLVGTWKLPLNGGPWVWEIHRDGTYSFHSEAGDGAPPPRARFLPATDIGR